MDAIVQDNTTSTTQVQKRERTALRKTQPKTEKVRAELNIERWPAMWQPSKSKTKAAVRTFSREVSFSDGTRGTAQLEVGFTQFGTVTTEDQRMLYALVKQWEDTGKPNTQVFFSDRLLARLLKKSWGTNVIDAITGSLRRLRLTPFRWIKSYHRSETPGKQVEEEVPFTLLSDLKIIKRKTDGHVTNQQGYFQFDRNLLENLLANYTKPLLLEEFFKLKSEIAQLIYSHIDLVMADKPRYERCTKDLFRDLGLVNLTYYRHASHRKQALDKALVELRGIQLSTGTLRGATVERTKDGKDYKVIFQKGARVALPEEEATEVIAIGLDEAPVVVNDYSKTKDPLVAQAEEMVRHFHKTVHGTENHYPQPKEVSQAVSLIGQHGLLETKHIIEYAARKATETNFQMQHFGAVLSYAPRAIAELDRRSSPEPITARPAPRVESQPDPSWMRGEQRLSALIAEQYQARFAKAKAELIAQNPFLARTWREGGSHEKMVRARVVRELAAEPTELVFLPPWLDALCQWHRPAQNLPI